MRAKAAASPMAPMLGYQAWCQADAYVLMPTCCGELELKRSYSSIQQPAKHYQTMVNKYRMRGQTPNTASIHTVHVVRVALFLSYTAYQIFLVVEAVLCSLRLAVLSCPVDAL